MRLRELFHGKMEDLPVIGELLLCSYERDLTDFRLFSSFFSEGLIDTVREKIALCRESVRSSSTLDALKQATSELYGAMPRGRTLLTLLEGYIRIAGERMDVPLSEFGIRLVRRSINRENADTLPGAIAVLLKNIDRNLEALLGAGMSAELRDEIAEFGSEIERLNTEQRIRKEARNRETEQILRLHNELWLSLTPIFKTGKTLYRGRSESRSADYTFSQLERRLHPELEARVESASKRAKQPDNQLFDISPSSNNFSSDFISDPGTRMLGMPESSDIKGRHHTSIPYAQNNSNMHIADLFSSLESNTEPISVYAEESSVLDNGNNYQNENTKISSAEKIAKTENPDIEENSDIAPVVSEEIIPATEISEMPEFSKSIEFDPFENDAYDIRPLSSNYSPTEPIDIVSLELTTLDLAAIQPLRRADPEPEPAYENADAYYGNAFPMPYVI